MAYPEDFNEEMEPETIIDQIINDEGACTNIPSEDCWNTCPLLMFCTSHLNGNITEGDTLKWATAVKENGYVVSDNLICEVLL